MSESIFIFRRDLRIDDNTGLLKTLSTNKSTIPIFIFTPEQLENENKYRSMNCIQFMIESLQDLDTDIRNRSGSKLFYFYGTPHIIIEKILTERKGKINQVCVNMDYTPYSRQRDQKIEEVFKKMGVEFISTEDSLLLPVESVLTGGGTVYTKFTPYFRKARTRNNKIPKPQKATSNQLQKLIGSNTRIDGQFDDTKINKFYTDNPSINVHGGRTNALKIIKNVKLINSWKKYNKERDQLCYRTTYLSAYNKFGCLSIREVYWTLHNKLGNQNQLITQLFWRDFYYNIAYAYPRVLQGKSLKEKYDKLKWTNANHGIGKTLFDAWKNGLTGFPIVDACMRQLNTTGFMHNRGRLIVSNFLIKILLIDWREGERYFAQQLVDYDPSQNNGGWTWSSGSGADSQPYFRIFNPWLQGERFDKNGIYIRKWIPELTNIDTKILHKGLDKEMSQTTGYPEPIVDYKKQKEKAMKMYSAIFT